jgi:hypothetical protein
MLYPIKTWYQRLSHWGQRYLDWLSVNTWRCVIGLYVTGVVLTFALWGIAKLAALLIIAFLN